MMEQRTPEWFAQRLGKATASRIDDATAKGRAGPSLTREKYKTQLVSERLTGIPQGPDLSANKSVQWGIENEAAARETFEFAIGYRIAETGFVDHPSIAMTGASPDGLVDDDSVLELKCPDTTTHIGYLRAGVVPSEYRKQMMWQIACTGRKFAWFASFDPRLNLENQLFLVKFEPPIEELAALEDDVRVFLTEVSDLESWLRNRK